MKIGFVMDPIQSINIKKDTTFAMMLEAQKRGHELVYIRMQDLYISNGQPRAQTAKIRVQEDDFRWFTIGTEIDINLGELDAILMRKDPPVDANFIYATQMFDLAEQQGTLVVNKASALRDFNEKLFTSYYPDLIPDTLVTSDNEQIRAFHAKHQDIICKPLDGMGGTSIFRVKADGNNLGVIIETLTHLGTRYAMFQRYLPEIKDGDKRVLIVDGEVVPYCLARIPTNNETRGNLAAGGRGQAQKLSDEELTVAQQVAKDMSAKGILFVGLDMIGTKITEINITSPTCVREIEAAYDINICAMLFDAIERRIAS